MKSLSLEGRVALVTGSSRGLGRHIALQLAHAGADVVVLARTRGESESAPESVRAVAGEVRALGRRALEAVADVSDDDAVGAAVARVLAEWGRIDILVNNAGIVATQPLLQMPPRRLDLLWRINVRAPAVFIQACAPGMIERRWGHIINIASLSSQVRENRVPLGYAGYTATKSALVRLGQALALELQPHGVAVNALAPSGLVETEGWLRIANGQRLPNAEPIEYVGRAVAWIAAQDPARFSGRFLESQQVLAMAGILESPALTFADLPQVDVSKWGVP
jgi:NAD(P)-dependent dehydrogenase (short-subunit alcohol dehydrogenase family)